MKCFKGTKNEYDIDVFDDFGFFDKIKDRYSKVLVVTDKNVYDIYSKNIQDLSDCCCILEGGERCKNIDSILKIYSVLLESGFDRKSVIIALGGGVVGDMAGFAASTYMRGIDFLQFPTTLLSQVDSSVGGKTGFDYMDVKNIIGSFYQPKGVYININTLKSLPKREFSAGMAEIIKHGIVLDRTLLTFVGENSCKILNMDVEILSKMILWNCKIKADIVSKDEKERGLRSVLNFGHTIGHAIETAKDFSLLHGECVALGMVSVMDISVRRGILSEGLRDFAESVIKEFNLPLKCEINISKAMEIMKMDKKKDKNSIKFVLATNEGFEFCNDITDDEIIAAFDRIKIS